MKLLIYQDANGEWRWHLRARNGKIVAESGEGYKSKSKCESAISKVANYFTDPFKDEVRNPITGSILR